ncbi:MAG: hypothetical protein RLZZ519_1652 [Bacteroidota bacterium]|jgi:hypothetical protein
MGRRQQLRKRHCGSAVVLAQKTLLDILHDALLVEEKCDGITIDFEGIENLVALGTDDVSLGPLASTFMGAFRQKHAIRNCCLPSIS